jgi:hypothetical protein
MTSPDDVPRDEPSSGAPDGHVEPQPPLDEDAAWREIVAHYGDRPVMGPETEEQAAAVPEPVAPESLAPPERPVEPATFDRSYLDALDEADEAPAPGRHDDEHFVPPVPPPVPRPTPARRLAWIGLFAPPVLMLAAVVFGWTFPGWLALGLVAGFVGGFVFLVATMPRDGGDGWGDGAVV